mmetsp:Transcript_36602/g.79746  ORF Transcript_36602/g.79746 Transcript_36602/m.79746 type:complete len:264 (-) Transcript_36602:840-1631(-)
MSLVRVWLSTDGSNSTCPVSFMNTCLALHPGRRTSSRSAWRFSSSVASVGVSASSALVSASTAASASASGSVGTCCLRFFSFFFFFADSTSCVVALGPSSCAFCSSASGSAVGLSPEARLRACMTLSTTPPGGALAESASTGSAAKSSAFFFSSCASGSAAWRAFWRMNSSIALLTALFTVCSIADWSIPSMLIPSSPSAAACAAASDAVEDTAEERGSAGEVSSVGSWTAGSDDRESVSSGSGASPTNTSVALMSSSGDGAP